MKKDRTIRRELLDELLAGYSKPEDLTGPEGLLKQLTGAQVIGDEGARERPRARETLFARQEPPAPGGSSAGRNYLGSSPHTSTPAL